MAKIKYKNYFSFQDGYCHILPDKILLTQNANPDESQLAQKKTVPYTQVATYAFFSIIFSLYFFDQYQFGNKFLAFIFLIFASLFSIGSINLLTMKLTPIIEKSKIKSVKYVKKIPVIAPASIQIEFYGGNKKKESTWLYLKDEQVNEALEVLKSHKLLS